MKKSVFLFSILLLSGVFSYGKTKGLLNKAPGVNPNKNYVCNPNYLPLENPSKKTIIFWAEISCRSKEQDNILIWSKFCGVFTSHKSCAKLVNKCKREGGYVFEWFLD